MLIGCVNRPVVDPRMPQAPGTVRVGRQARYERPQGEAPAPATERMDAAVPASPRRDQMLLWLLIGLAVVGTTAFFAEGASRRGGRDE